MTWSGFEPSDRSGRALSVRGRGTWLARSIAKLMPHVSQPLALIVDRDTDTRCMYADYLQLTRWNSHEVGDGRDGLIEALTGYYDVIITETRLPSIDGYHLCRILKHDWITATVPIVFLTGDAFARDVDRAYQAGGDVVLTKPCLPDRLLAELNRQLARATTLPTWLEAGRGRPLAKLTESAEPCRSCQGRLIYLDRCGAPGAFNYSICMGACGTFRYDRHAIRPSTWS